ncbi:MULTISPECIES: UDP-N-acetylmuramate dehydrogenase [Streptomyces]|uniref:UDP-N-acetylenolpyruvoylglucosamine reductase n=1 Tax=Streptomyces eurythermus TaxID=42237 RepID=A0ABW6Z982_9ACTN|nr:MULTISPECIES: UDP-N-acetylmuramate dehydrogenase [Streptomyces]QIS68707.1 UDP-N-acetylmuramate dehydrogenase [Streptomyces sp. DSM 40868]
MGELLADHTTLCLGGPADQFLTHTAPAAWPELTHAARRSGTAPFVLGGGSNTLAADTGYPGTVIRMATRGIAIRPLGDNLVEVTVQAGEPLGSLVAFTVTESLSGIEYLGGIPGTTGAAPVQNTGAYGQQVSDTLTRLTVHDWALGRTRKLRPDQCRFGYWTSTFKTQPGRFTILDVSLRLTRRTYASPIRYQHLADALAVRLGGRPPLAEAAQAVLTDRHNRGLTLPAGGPDARQAGSVFLNPSVAPAQATAIRAAGGPVHHSPDGSQRASAGWLLEQAGFLPGTRVSPGVYCSQARALTLTARDGATAPLPHPSRPPSTFSPTRFSPHTRSAYSPNLASHTQAALHSGGTHHRAHSADHDPGGDRVKLPSGRGRGSGRAVRGAVSGARRRRVLLRPCRSSTGTTDCAGCPPAPGQDVIRTGTPVVRWSIPRACGRPAGRAQMFRGESGGCALLMP